MVQRVIKANDFENVVSGGTAILRVPVGDFTYAGIRLRYTESGSDVNQATMETAITKIEVQADGVSQQVYSANELFAINNHLGVPTRDGRLPLPLTVKGFEDRAVEDGLEWGTANLQSLTVKVTIASGRTAPALSAHLVGRPEKRVLGRILQFEQGVITPGASNALHRILNQENLGRPIIGFFCETTAMTYVNYKVGQTNILQEAEIAELNAIYAEHPELDEVSGWSIINFAHNGRLAADAMPLTANGIPLINQTAELFMTSTSPFNVVTALMGEARR